MPPAASRRPPLAAARRFFATPKGLLLIVLAFIVSLASWAAGPGKTAPGLLAAVGSAALLDLVILRLRSGEWEFPSGAILTGLIVAAVLSAQESWTIAALASAIGIAGKYIFRSKSANIFNPAALGIVVMTYAVTTTGESWWGAFGGSAAPAVVWLLAGGIFIAARVNKLPLAVTFLGVYFGLFTLAAYMGMAAEVAEVFRPPDLGAVLFFAFFILTDPPTSPVRYRGQMVCGALTAVASFAIFTWWGVDCYLLAAVLLANVGEAGNRALAAARRAAPRLRPA